MITEIKRKLRPKIVKEKAARLPEKTLGAYYSIMIGSDPEFFFKKGTRVIGSERIIGKDGIVTRPPDPYVRDGKPEKIIVDGVQAELNPLTTTCRQGAASTVGNMLINADREAKKHGAKVVFDTLVKVTKTELNKLSPESRTFGCDPSLNAYGEEHIMPDPTTYMYRAAGGHIHIGGAYGGGKNPLEHAFKHPVETVKVLDIIAGNTFVLIDKSEGNAERRKAYGRAGEYRLPKHGIEYRVLSNFWLRHRVLAWLAFGLVREGMNIAAHKDMAQAFIDAVPEEDVRNAINQNDEALARKNFDRIKPLIAHVTRMSGSDNYALNASNMNLFELFLEKGYKHWLGRGSISSWKVHPGGRQSHIVRGWESWLRLVVGPELARKI